MAARKSTKTSADLKSQVQEDLKDLKDAGPDTSVLGFQEIQKASDNAGLDLGIKKSDSRDEPKRLRDSDLGEATKIETPVREKSEEERLKEENAALRKMLIDRQNADAHVGDSNYEKQSAALRAQNVKSEQLRILPKENHKLSHNTQYWNLKKGVPVFVHREAAIRAVNAEVATII